MADSNIRIALTDGSGRYFLPGKATSWDENTRWDGSNLVSEATGSKWEHERLYRTSGGRWILRHWSQWQGVATTHSEIDGEEAARWLAINGHDAPPACAAAFAALEIR